MPAYSSGSFFKDNGISPLFRKGYVKMNTMKKYKYLSILLIIIVGVVTVTADHKAIALSCAPTSLQEQINGADVIFAGKVTSIQTATSEKAANASYLQVSIAV